MTSQILQVAPERSSEGDQLRPSAGRLGGRQNQDSWLLEEGTVMIKDPFFVKVEPLQPEFKHFNIIFKYTFSNLKNKFYFTTKLVNIEF